MTAEDHNKWLAFAHLGYAALHLLMGVFFGVMMITMFSGLPPSPTTGSPPPPSAFFIVMAGVVLVFHVGWVVPSMIAAYALLKRKAWAKTAGIVAGVFAAAQMPVGTAVAVYTFWFMFGDLGRSLYDRSAKTLPAGQPHWTPVDNEKRVEHDYAPSPSPPDWR